MKKAGIREARQRLSELIEDVQKGREITLTDRGRPVARLIPVKQASQKKLAARKAFRASLSWSGPSLTATLEADREDRF